MKAGKGDAVKTMGNLTLDIKVSGVFKFKVKLAFARLLAGLLSIVVCPATVRFRVYEQGRDRTKALQFERGVTKRKGDEVRVLSEDSGVLPKY